MIPDGFHIMGQVATANVATHPTNRNTPADIVAFHHNALWSPSLSTLETAITKQFLPALLGLSLQALQKHPPSLEATTMGNLDG